GQPTSDQSVFSLDSPGGACVVSLSLMSLGLLSVHVSIPKQMVVVDSNLVDNDVVKSHNIILKYDNEDDDDDDGDECEGRKKLEVKAHQASHTNYLMMRGYCCPGIVKLRNLNINDNIVVESCIMKLQLRSTPAHHLFNSPPPDFTKCGPSLLPSMLTCSFRPSSSSPSVEQCDRCLVEQRGYTPQDIEACAQLRRSLDKAGETGLDVHELYEALAQQEEPQCGRTRSMQHENVSFISRPWRMVDGKLNRQVCKGMLEALLYHIMYQPGLTQQTLVEHYKDVLQPLAVLDLVQALIDMGCVTKKTLVKGPKPTLFGHTVHQTKSETGVKTEDPDTVFYEPTISCCLRLSQVLPNERHWNNCLP
uniref:Uncharacterized protein n=1 Tax=Lates calcarifer TaxID=8187 RepID=A0A4W6DK61_LATCA